MKVSYIKKYYVEHYYTDEQKSFKTLTAAVKYVLEKKDTNLLIHIGGYNLDYYHNGDTFESLYNRCATIVAHL